MAALISMPGFPPGDRLKHIAVETPDGRNVGTIYVDAWYS